MKRGAIDACIGLVLFFVVAAPVCAGITVYTASTLWDWFLAPQYGAGPSHAAWYGIAMLVAMLTISLARTKTDFDGLVESALFEILKALLVATVTLGMAFVVREMNGW